MGLGLQQASPLALEGARIDLTVRMLDAAVPLSTCEHMRPGIVLGLCIPLSELRFRLEVPGAGLSWTASLVAQGEHVGLRLVSSSEFEGSAHALAVPVLPDGAPDAR